MNETLMPGTYVSARQTLKMGRRLIKPSDLLWVANSSIDQRATGAFALARKGCNSATALRITAADFATYFQVIR